MGGACTQPDAPKAAFAVLTLSVLTNVLYISYFTDKVCNSFHSTQNEQYEIIFLCSGWKQVVQEGRLVEAHGYLVCSCSG